MVGTQGTSTSCLDLTFVTSGLADQAEWFTGIATHGSDHTPKYTILRNLNLQYRTQIAKCVNWVTFPDGTKDKTSNVTTYTKFIDAICEFNHEVRKYHKLPIIRTTINAEFQRIRASRRRAERWARSTQSISGAKIANYL